MKLLELHLKAFGPFTDRRLDLSGGQEGLHVIYGPNEAGKSTTLRAVKALLFGFPARSEDGFLHDNPQLRVGGRLRLADGRELEFVRRKGTKSTLLSPADESPLDDGLLDRCLRGMEEKLFSSLFGIDHGALLQGGRELLDQHGDVGQALFAAGLGTRNLRRVLQALDDEADGLFLPRGSKPLVNLGIAELREVKRALSEASLSGREWEGQRREIERKREESEALERELVALKSERNRLQRLRRVLPRLAERRELSRKLDELGDVAILPPDFPARRREALDTLRSAGNARVRAENELKELRGEGAGLSVAGPLLAQAETIERLHQGVGRFIKDVGDRSKLLTERSGYLAQAEELLDEIRPGLTPAEAEALRPTLDRWVRIQELGNQRQALVNARDLTAQAFQEAEQTLAATRESLDTLPALRDPAGLRRAVDTARKAGGLDRALAEAIASLQEEEEQLRVDLARLGLWRGTPEELEALPVPAAAILESFRDAFAAFAERHRGTAERRREVADQLAEAERGLDEIRRAGSVPSESDLTEARERRDQGWALLRRLLEGGDAPAPAPDRYEQSVAEADEVADRLRRQAERVERRAQLEARRESLARDVAALDAEEARMSGERAALEEDWQALWRPCGINPLPPREMQAWAAEHEKLRARMNALRASRRRPAAFQEAIDNHRSALIQELEKLGEAVPSSVSLEPVLEQGEELVRLLDEEARRRADLGKALRDAESRLAAARKEEEKAASAFEAWRGEWDESIRDLGLGRDARPSEVQQLLDALRKVSDNLGKARERDRRIAGLDRDLESFRTDVRALAVEIAPDQVDRPADQAVVQLNALLRDARRQAGRREDLDRRIEKLEGEIRDAEATRLAMEDRLEDLRGEAGREDGDLDEAERLSSLHRELTRDLDRCERQLLEDGEGATIAELEREAEGVEADALPGRIEQLDQEIEECDRRSKDLREALGREQRELEHKTGGTLAAEAAERSQEVLASLQENVQRYTRLRLAASLLRREIERYRAENQAPLLRRAGDLFATLTLGHFTGLQTDFDDRDEPVLAGVRMSGKAVRVEGMSEGTRDQLYLALRLATLERYLAHAEPLPFIVDDILINFDDARSRATLKVLAELSGKTQVILFTHHERLKEMAAAMNGNGGAGVFVRELP